MRVRTEGRVIRQHTLKESGLPQTQTERDVQHAARRALTNLARAENPYKIKGTGREESK
jgi:hypothetical protein